MKSRFIALSLFAATTTIGYSATSSAEICYDVSGSLTTENITPALQIGNMDFILSDDTGEVFRESGSLVGNITGADAYGRTILSHQARFPQGDSFRTEGDSAALTPPYVAGAEEDGTPCAFFIDEKITSIPKGTGFFKNVTSADVTALGTVSNCSFHNENAFELSGQLCVE